MPQSYPLHYPPFGSSLPNRTWSDANRGYRFGFNAQEKDNEISGEGNSYTAEFWQYDGRLGRRFNLDPVIYPYLSSYSVLSANPIYNIDKFGDKFGKNSEQIDKLEIRINEIKKNNLSVSNFYQKKIDKKKEKLRTRGKSENEINSSKLIQRIEVQKKKYDETITECDDALSEINILRNSEWIYDINLDLAKDNLVGLCSYSTVDNHINISVDPNLKGDKFMSTLAHELKHGYQFEVGKIAFVFKSDGNSGILFYDIEDEIETHNRENRIFREYNNVKIDENFIKYERGYDILTSGQNVVNMCNRNEIMDYYYNYNFETWNSDRKIYNVSGLIIYNLPNWNEIWNLRKNK